MCDVRHHRDFRDDSVNGVMTLPEIGSVILGASCSTSTILNDLRCGTHQVIEQDATRASSAVVSRVASVANSAVSWVADFGVSVRRARPPRARGQERELRSQRTHATYATDSGQQCNLSTLAAASLFRPIAEPRA